MVGHPSLELGPYHNYPRWKPYPNHDNLHSNKYVFLQHDLKLSILRGCKLVLGDPLWTKKSQPFGSHVLTWWSSFILCNIGGAHAQRGERLTRREAHMHLMSPFLLWSSLCFGIRISKIQLAWAIRTPTEGVLIKFDPL